MKDMNMSNDRLRKSPRRSFWVRTDAAFDASGNTSTPAGNAAFLEDFG
jgi:hypothetical protein